MKKLCITVGIVCLIPLNLKAPNLDKSFRTTRFEQVILEHIEYEKLQERVNTILTILRIIESKNNYHLRGHSREYGAYQFTRSTWNNYSKLFFNEVLDITIPENQDKVARTKVEMLIQKGLTDEEIASFWNSGKRRWKNKIGTNRYGINYNVPKYVKKFIKTKKELKCYEI